MSAKSLGLANRLQYLARRIRGFNFGSLLSRAREVKRAHGKSVPAVLVDMLWSAVFRNVAFQDYVDYDFATLTREERATFMTHSISNHIAMKFDHPDYREGFHNKLNFNAAFDEFLCREWMDVRLSSTDELREFMERNRRVIGKVPVSDSGHGISRYEIEDIDDWESFRTMLMGKGQHLVEANIEQHHVLAAVCAGTANTTRITTFHDIATGTTHVLSMAQKFGRGQASDQQTFGGFYTMLDMNGKSQGPGYDSHGGVHNVHPESGVSIVDFKLPMVNELFEFIDKVSKVVPQMQYIGWDVVITETGPVLVEGNWGAGVYENKPSVTGIRHGSLPRFRQVVGF